MYAAYNGTDYRKATYEFPEYSFTNNSVVNGRPEKSKIADYFYPLPKASIEIDNYSMSADTATIGRLQVQCTTLTVLSV